MEFDHQLKDGNMLASAPNLSLFGPDLSVADLRTLAAEARAGGDQDEISPVSDEAQSTLGYGGDQRGYMRATESRRPAAKERPARGSRSGPAWK
ncbi:unnamed protein product [Symbiodinium microadriaticum]|nr:unnamed protein product [Symbiodinium microadriaticum]